MLPGNLEDSLPDMLQTDSYTYYSLPLHSTISYATTDLFPKLLIGLGYSVDKTNGC